MISLNKRMNDFIRSLGPGIITGALVLGPGTLTVTSKLGSLYQYKMLWVIAVSILFMIVFTIISARYGFYNKISLIETIKIRYGRWVAYLVGISIFIVAISFQAGNSIGAGLALSSIFDAEPVPWIILCSITAMATLFFRSFYKILEKIMIILVLIMLSSFLITVIISKPDLKAMFLGFVPTIPSGSEILSIAMVATSCSLAGAFYQSYLVQEKSRNEAGFTSCKVESITGIVILGVISSLVMVVAGSVLFVNDISVNTAADMGKALEPLFGSFSFIVFMIGLFSASFSSLLGNATLGGNIIADTFGFGKTHEQWTTRLSIMSIIIIGSLIAIVFSGFRLRLIVFAQAFTVLALPVIAFVLWKINREKSLIKSYQNSPITSIMGLIGVILLIGLAVIYVYLQYLRH